MIMESELVAVFLDALEIADDRTIQVLLVDPTGAVVWRTDRSGALRLRIDRTGAIEARGKERGFR